jgi:hypothetical protein
MQSSFERRPFEESHPVTLQSGDDLFHWVASTKGDDVVAVDNGGMA